MKQNLSTRIFASLLALLGFGSMVGCDGGGGGMCMYGTPQGTFEYKAKVVDPAKVPLEGVQVTSVDSYGGYSYRPPFDSPFYIKTDANGMAGQASFVASPDSVFLFVHDPAGRFADTLCGYKVQPSEFSAEGKGDWNWGKVTKSVEIQVKTIK